MTTGVNFSWPEYLNVAKHLSGKSCVTITEARLRSSIGRAYYAAFCEARNYLRDVDHDPNLSTSNPQRNKTHWYVIRSFRNSTDPQRRQVAKLLSLLRDRRNEADYQDIFHGNLPKDVALALQRSQQIISMLSNI